MGGSSPGSSGSVVKSFKNLFRSHRSRNVTESANSPEADENTQNENGKKVKQKKKSKSKQKDTVMVPS